MGEGNSCGRTGKDVLQVCPQFVLVASVPSKLLATKVANWTAIAFHCLVAAGSVEIRANEAPLLLDTIGSRLAGTSLSTNCVVIKHSPSCVVAT